MTADWVSSATPLYLEVRGPVPSLVTIEPNHPSIGAGIEDLVFTLTRTGATTDELVAKVTIVQDQSWLAIVGPLPHRDLRGRQRHRGR